MFPGGLARSFARLEGELASVGATVGCFALGGAHAVALVEGAGVAFAWGWGDRGQVGSGAAAAEGAPRAIDPAAFLRARAGGALPVPLTEAGGALLGSRAPLQPPSPHPMRGRGGGSAVPPRHAAAQLAALLGAPAAALPTPLYRLRAVAAGEEHCLALGEDGFVFSWGGGRRGQLGVGAAAEVVVGSATARTGSCVGGGPRGGPPPRCALHPQLVRLLPPDGEGGAAAAVGQVRASIDLGLSASLSVRAIFAAGTHSLALTVDGVLFGWGGGVVAGGGERGADLLSPAPVPGLLPHRVVAAATGPRHAAAVTAGGDVYTWGEAGLEGALGGGWGAGDTARRAPMRVEGLPGKDKVASVACGAAHTLALTAGGRVYAWGANGYGQLGLGAVGPLREASLRRGEVAGRPGNGVVDPLILLPPACPVPALVWRLTEGGGPRVTALAAGARSSYALCGEGDGRCGFGWGAASGVVPVVEGGSLLAAVAPAAAEGVRALPADALARARYAPPPPPPADRPVEALAFGAPAPLPLAPLPGRVPLRLAPTFSSAASLTLHHYSQMAVTEGMLRERARGGPHRGAAAPSPAAAATPLPRLITSHLSQAARGVRGALAGRSASPAAPLALPPALPHPRRKQHAPSPAPTAARLSRSLQHVLLVDLAGFGGGALVGAAKGGGSGSPIAAPPPPAPLSAPPPAPRDACEPELVELLAAATAGRFPTAGALLSGIIADAASAPAAAAALLGLALERLRGTSLPSLRVLVDALRQRAAAAALAAASEASVLRLNAGRAASPPRALHPVASGSTRPAQPAYHAHASPVAAKRDGAVMGLRSTPPHRATATAAAPGGAAAAYILKHPSQGAPRLLSAASAAAASAASPLASPRARREADPTFAVFTHHRDTLLDVGTGAASTTMYGMLHSHSHRGGRAPAEVEVAEDGDAAASLPFLKPPLPSPPLGPPLRAPASEGLVAGANGGGVGAGQGRPPRRSPPPPPFQPELKEADADAGNDLFAARAATIANSFRSELMRSEVALALEKAQGGAPPAPPPPPTGGATRGMQRLSSEAIHARMISAAILQRTEDDYDAL